MTLSTSFLQQRNINIERKDSGTRQRRLLSELSTSDMTLWSFSFFMNKVRIQAYQLNSITGIRGANAYEMLRNIWQNDSQRNSPPSCDHYHMGNDPHKTTQHPYHHHHRHQRTTILSILTILSIFAIITTTTIRVPLSSSSHHLCINPITTPLVHLPHHHHHVFILS